MIWVFLFSFYRSGNLTLEKLRKLLKVIQQVEYSDEYNSKCQFLKMYLTEVMYCISIGNHQVEIPLMYQEPEILIQICL